MIREQKKEKNIIIYIQFIPSGAIKSIREYGRKEKKKFRVMLLQSSTERNKKTLKDFDDLDLLVECDFTKPDKIAKALMPYYDELYAITSRTESSTAKFIKVIPHIPYLKTPSVDSLNWATDKLQMRKRLKMFNPKHTPKFTRVRGNTIVERKRLAKVVGFPMMIKPTNLAQSMLVTICYHEEELKKILATVNRKINKVYKESKRTEEPKIIAEEYMEGEMYSIDSYVNSKGTIYHTPAVKVITGRNIGHADFFNYMRITPTTLKKESVEKAQASVENAIHALGLRSTTTHTELLRVDDDWKIIEVGSRIGGYRNRLFRLACGFDHSINDILIRVSKKPIIPKKCFGSAATLEWFPKKEGKIVELKGIKKIQDLKSFKTISISKKVGDRVQFAKNGGKAVFSVTLFNKERSKLLADIRRIEQSVVVKVK